MHMVDFTFFFFAPFYTLIVEFSFGLIFLHSYEL